MKQTPITSATVAEQIIRPFIQGIDHEECWGIFLSCSNAVLEIEMLSKGTLTSTSIDARTVLRRALLLNARAIILLHNHPSGCPFPSSQDIRLTDQIKKACSLLDVQLLDHIIIADKSFYSFAEEQTYQNR